MIQTTTAINVFSEINSQIDLVILLEDEADTEKAKLVITNAYDKWFDLESEPDLQFEPIGEYIASRLDAEGIKHEMYSK